jgi:hypothetical protein
MGRYDTGTPKLLGRPGCENNMIELDPLLLTPDVATVLLLRGAAIPPLSWHAKPNPTARQILQGSADDAKLLARADLANPAMAAAVRALLYFWNGWPAECAQFVAAAPPAERSYILGLIERQARHPDRAKPMFQQVPEHAIYTPLATFALAALAGDMVPALRRFRDILKLDGRWETCAFIDLYEQAHANKLGGPGEELVRRFQCREFELLLQHCYEAATGAPLAARDTGPKLNTAALARLRERKQTQQRRSSKPASPTETVAEPAEHGPAHPHDVKTPLVVVQCPKCNTRASVPAFARGGTYKCIQCSTVFLVPADKGSGPGAAVHRIGVQCPKCATVIQVPESARGQKHPCPKCETIVLVPMKKAAAHA